jgi:hypothetical protein
LAGMVRNDHALAVSQKRAGRAATGTKLACGAGLVGQLGTPDYARLTLVKHYWQMTGHQPVTGHTREPTAAWMRGARPHPWEVRAGASVNVQVRGHAGSAAAQPDPGFDGGRVAAYLSLRPKKPPNEQDTPTGIRFGGWFGGKVDWVSGKEPGEGLRSFCSGAAVGLLDR